MIPLEARKTTKGIVYMLTAKREKQNRKTHLGTTLFSRLFLKTKQIRKLRVFPLTLQFVLNRAARAAGPRGSAARLAEWPSPALWRKKRAGVCYEILRRLESLTRPPALHLH